MDKPPSSSWGQQITELKHSVSELVRRSLLVKRQSKAPQGPPLVLGSGEEKLRERVSKFLTREKNDTTSKSKASRAGLGDESPKE